MEDKCRIWIGLYPVVWTYGEGCAVDVMNHLIERGIKEHNLNVVEPDKRKYPKCRQVVVQNHKIDEIRRLLENGEFDMVSDLKELISGPHHTIFSL